MLILAGSKSVCTSHVLLPGFVDVLTKCVLVSVYSDLKLPGLSGCLEKAEADDKISNSVRH